MSNTDTTIKEEAEMLEKIYNEGITEKTEQYIQDHADELVDEIDQFDEEVQEEILNNL